MKVTVVNSGGGGGGAPLENRLIWVFLIEIYTNKDFLVLWPRSSILEPRCLKQSAEGLREAASQKLVNSVNPYIEQVNTTHCTIQAGCNCLFLPRFIHWEATWNVLEVVPAAV